MKKLLVSLFLVANVFFSFGQPREKEAHYTYLSIETSVFTNTPGTISQKLFMTAEVGRTFGIFDIGIAAGRLNLVNAKSGADSNWFAEVLPTINVFSKGRFSEALTLGAGHIFHRKENFLTEITNSINFAPNNRTIITVYQGNYFLDGKLSTSKAQFMGLSVTFNCIKKNTKTDVLRRKSLLN
ncbi:MAG: hypothetical protein M3015_01700 [Bacteroidota bacterium]|nr:hypothetical protein [Bacteroidota bacterium]